MIFYIFFITLSDISNSLISVNIRISQILGAILSIFCLVRILMKNIVTQT